MNMPSNVSTLLSISKGIEFSLFDPQQHRALLNALTRVRSRFLETSIFQKNTCWMLRMLSVKIITPNLNI